MVRKERPRIGALISGIDADGFERSRPQQPKTGVGLVMGSIDTASELERQLAETREQLDAAQTQLATHEQPTKLDPTTIQRSRWANRDAANFEGPAWQSFKDEIVSAGGNIQAIKVRPLPDAPHGQPQYELVFGHRRWQACLEEKLLVSTTVDHAMTDAQLFIEMDRENRERQDLSPWEQGRAYLAALSGGLFASQKKLAEGLGVDQGNVSRACALANLPADIIQAFPSPFALQYRMVKPLTDTLQRDPEAMLERARALHSKRGELTSSEVLAKLLANEPTHAATVQITVNGHVSAIVKAGPRGRTVVEFNADVVPRDRYEGLSAVIADFLKRQRP
jgi:ParB family chromosome partitioning protein